MHLFGIPLNGESTINSFDYIVDDEMPKSVTLVPTAQTSEYFVSVPYRAESISCRFTVADGAEFELSYEVKQRKKMGDKDVDTVIDESTPYEMLENTPEFQRDPHRRLRYSELKGQSEILSIKNIREKETSNQIPISVVVRY